MKIIFLTLMTFLVGLSSQAQVIQSENQALVKTKDVLDVVCDINVGTVSLTYYVANGITHLSSTFQISDILTSNDRLLMMAHALNPNFTAEDINKVTQDRCNEMAKSYLKDIKKIDDGVVNFRLNERYDVESFYVYNLGFVDKARFASEELTQRVSDYFLHLKEKLRK